MVVMLYVRFPLSLRNVEDLLFERGIYLCHETVRLWWNRFGPLFAADIRRQRVIRMRGFRHWKSLTSTVRITCCNKVVKI
jgi:putative transposase